MTLAPSEGYTNVYGSAHAASETGWSGGEWHDRFFLKTRLGQLYARIQVTVDSFYDPTTGQGRLEIEYAANPSGPLILR
jgi:hypothetical protein